LTVVAITFRNAPAWVGARETSSAVAEPPLGIFPIAQRAVAPAVVQLPLLATAEKKEAPGGAAPQSLPLPDPLTRHAFNVVWVSSLLPTFRRVTV
jgi:hypothetical protein